MKNLIFRMTSLHLQKMGSVVKVTALAVVCLIFTLPMNAQKHAHSKQKGSSVILNTWDGRGFIIEIDGKRHRADGSITLRNVRPGNKRIRVMRTNMRPTHNYSNRGGSGVVLYSGYINVPRNSRVRAKITRGKSLQILSINRLGQNRPNGNRPSGSCSSGAYNPHQGQLDEYGYESYYEDHWNDEYYDEESYGFEPYGEEHDYGYGGVCAIENMEFNRFIERLEREPFSSNKQSLTRQMLRHNHITSEQLMRILLTYSFDSDRIEVAKSAYDKVIDKENTWEIYSAFTFSSTADEFDDFVNGCR